MEFKDLKALAVAAMGAEKNAPIAYSCNIEGKTENFSSSELNKALRAEFNKLTGYVEGQGMCWADYRENKNTIFRLIEETIDEVLPPRVEKQYMQFADTITIAQGDKAVFKLKVTEASRRRAKTFVSSVGLAARYETFQLDGAQLEVKTGAIGAAARIGLEEFLDGRWEFSEFTSLMLEALDEYIYIEVIKALGSMVNSLPKYNKAVCNGFDEATMDNLLRITDTYGKTTIYCTQEFANKMIPSDQRMSDHMKEVLWEKNWLGSYKGHNVIILDQSLLYGTAEVNSTLAVDPSTAYLIPTGSEKPVKIVFEGQTQVHEVEYSDDWSRDIQTYTKVGIGTVAALGGIVWIGAYKDSSLGTDTRSDKHFFEQIDLGDDVHTSGEEDTGKDAGDGTEVTDTSTDRSQDLDDDTSTKEDSTESKKEDTSTEDSSSEKQDTVKEETSDKTSPSEKDDTEDVEISDGSTESTEV